MDDGETLSVTGMAASEQARLMRLASFASVGAALLLIALKFAAFLQTGSVSVLSTLFDSALDAAASIVNLIAVRQSLIPADAEHRFGHGKAEPLAGLIQVAFILGSSLILIKEVIDHFITPQPIAAPEIGIAVMVASLVVTGVLVLLQRSVVRRTGSIAIKSDQAHYATDFIVNFSVIAAFLLSAQLGWWWIDPAVGLAIAIFIAAAALRVGKEALDMLMDREMEEAERTRIKEIVRGHPQVLNLHDLRTRAAGRDKFIQFHLEMEGSLSLSDAHRISDAVEADVRAAFPGAEVIIHEDPAGVVEQRATFRYH
ncbi:MAG TPA: cation diffusion facilitator family transporter [Dongiaceae bacterium]|jgi:ferrous-iron efflux pump FieF|nr:cation diffusion facilitator family transporter [Dongiaceae bacterium]